MASITSIGIGSSPNDGTGDTLRVAGGKINSNFTAVNNEVVAATAAIAALGDLAALDTVDREHLSADIIDGTKIEDDAVGLEHLAAAAYASEAEAEAGTENTKIMTALRVAQAIAELGGGGGSGDGDMAEAVYDPQEIADDAFDRANHTGTQALATISDAGDLAALDTVDTAQIEDAAVTAVKTDADVGVRSSVEDTGDYSSTPKTMADEWGVERYFTDANDHIIAFPSGLTVGSHGWLIAPDSNTLDIRRVADSGVSIDGIAANGALSGSVGIVPAGGRRMWIVRDSNTIVTDANAGGATAAAQQLVADLDAGGFTIDDVSITGHKQIAGVADAAALSAGVVTVDLAEGCNFTVTINGSWNDGSPLAATNGVTSQVQHIMLVATISGTQTIDLSGLPWLGDAPTLDEADTDVLELIATFTGNTLNSVVAGNRS